MNPHLTSIIQIWKTTVQDNSNLHTFSHQINTKGELSAKIDLKLESALLDYFKATKLPLAVYSEEIGLVNLQDNPQELICFDPLDGTTNYRLSPNMYRYGLLFSWFNTITPNLNQVKLALLYEASHQEIFLYENHLTTNQFGQPVTLNSWEIETSTPVYVDLHASQEYLEYQNWAKQVFLRNTGSTIGNAAHVLSNRAAALAIPKQKAEEVGAIYALITGAGGTVTDFDGHDLGDQPLSPSQTYEVLGGNPQFVKKLTDLLRS